MACSDLCEEDLHALAAGRVTLRELAERVGVSAQAVSRFARRRGVQPPARSSKPAPTVRTERASPASRGGMVEITGREAALMAGRALLGLLARAGNTLADQNAELGPSSIRSLAAAIDVATIRLAALGFLDSEDATAKLPELVVRCLTDAEEAEIRQNLQVMAGAVFDDAEPVESRTP